VWLGAQVFINDGIHIADGAIVEPGSIVTSDVPPYAVVSGAPARIIRLRFSEAIIRRMLQLQWWHWDLSRVNAARPWFELKDPDAFLRWAEA
jgi:serine acetyltransferase